MIASAGFFWRVYVACFRKDRHQFLIGQYCDLPLPNARISSLSLN